MYGWQVYCTFMIPPGRHPRLVTWLRVLLALVDTLALLATASTGLLASAISEENG